MDKLSELTINAIKGWEKLVIFSGLCIFSLYIVGMVYYFMFFDFIKDIFTSPDESFKKFTPDYFLRQRVKMNSEKDYLKWLLKQEVHHVVMARMEKEKKRFSAEILD